MIIGYTRVSTAEQASKHATSLQAQEQVIRGVAMTRGATGYDVQIYSDPGVSGSVRLHERPAGKELLEAAQKGDVIVAAKLDRMFRSASDALNTAERLKDRGIHLILFDLGADPVTANGMAKCFFTMASAFAELERFRIYERMQVGRDQKRNKSGHLGGVAPYGFKVVGESRESRLVPNDDEQPILKEILELSHDNYTSWDITQKLANRGRTNRVGKPFECFQIKRIIDRAEVCNASHG